MAPRKRSSSSSSSSSSSALRKANNQPSQPSKFGIQHFFERHSQAAASSSSSTSPAPSIRDPNPNPNPPLIHLSTADPPPPPPTVATNGEGTSSEISPEATKSAPPKRFRFSPGMLIKQSQDDGADEITWKISPVNERLCSLASKNQLGMARVLADVSRPKGSTFHPCSRKGNTSSLNGNIKVCLSTPKTTSEDRPLMSSRKTSIQYSEVCESRGSNCDAKNDGTVDLKSPFRTPPSLSYITNELVNGVTCNGGANQLALRQHKKALLELLDQVEDAIMEEQVPSDPRHHGENGGNEDKIREVPDFAEISANTSSKKLSDAPPYDTFLVLEVSEKHRSGDSPCGRYPVKVLRLLNEQRGEERALYLYDEWFYSLIGAGDTVNVVGEFNDQGKCIVNHTKNLVIVHPEILISGTRVASSFSCPRRVVLDERLKATEHSISALIGTLLHQIFQAGLLKGTPSKLFLEEYAGKVLQKNIESLYACGGNEKDMHTTLFEAIPRISNWLTCFSTAEDSKIATIDFGHCDGSKAVGITEVVDIEEMAWAPRYGLKGMIDASVCVKIKSDTGGSYERLMPLEFKTGKGTTGHSAMEHTAQVILYTLLMSESRYSKKDIDSGLLYYLHTDQTMGIKVERSDLVGLIMRRNELATDILKASNTQSFPPMLQSPTMCKGCRHLNICTVYHKAQGGNSESSGLGDAFDSLVNHLSSADFSFLKHWDRLIDLEAKASQVGKKGFLRPRSLNGESTSTSLSSIILDGRNEVSVDASGKSDRYIYHFVRQKLHHEANDGVDSPGPGVNNLDCALRSGDCVVLSTESGHILIAQGVISDISCHHVSVSLPRPLRLPGGDPSLEMKDLEQVVWRIDKDEVASSYAIMRFNLIQLFAQRPQSSLLRQLIVDLEAPRFDTGGLFSQDPAISYVRSEKSLNDDQRRSIQKILTAKDYALILGMPGTGKTFTMVHAVKALLIRGASILITSYTNAAIDNLLIKLKSQGIDFVRIGRHGAVHQDVRSHCFSAMEAQSVDYIKQRMKHIQIVGVTCLGINHPLLAKKKFDICIMDEAGQTTLPVSLGPLMLASKFVLVGDHYQLPPLVQSTEAQESGMGISLFWRLSEAHPQAISALQCQYRMSAGIMELSNALIYGNRLRCGSSEIADAKLKYSSNEPVALWLKEIMDPDRSAVFVDTDQLPAPEEKERKAVSNPTEAYIVSQVTVELLKRGITGDEIGIITPYNSQANIIRQLIDTSVEVHTIDKYQGRDKDCVIVSFVRSSKNVKACTSSLLGDWHRINVVLTRAKKKLIMVGSSKTLSGIPLLRLLLEKGTK
ncbi:DNA replication ATP-dependent helicase/nuclease DNA2 isoform X2 [Ananas comosus]|uniref:DNA replication ATP-dependent helicase/nuclease n=1 Tax=Ananas comosus TaxID=4615 RepID=A0A6P5EWL0_ANACO|nr:DNA replication ATP-dependent helicase/nuclease DNA2 isoform X2 [Ananas comosus]